MTHDSLPALILSLKFAGEPRCRVRPVRRIKVDGHGRLLYWDAETGELVSIDAATLESVHIKPVIPTIQAA